MIGCIFSISSNSDYVRPNLNLDSGKNCLKNSALSSLNLEIMNQNFSAKDTRVISKLPLEHKAKSFSRTLFSQLRNTNDDLSNFDYEFGDDDARSENDFFYLERQDEISSKEKEYFIDLDQEEENEEFISNTRLDSYLDEIVELIVKDFIMSWLGNFIWEKESGKIVSLAR